VDNGPPDGAAPGLGFNSAQLPVVYINGLPATDVRYSALQSQYPGEWQVNVLIPADTPPGDKISIILFLQDQPSSVGGAPASPTVLLGTDRLLQGSLITTIAVK